MDWPSSSFTRRRPLWCRPGQVDHPSFPGAVLLCILLWQASVWVPFSVSLHSAHAVAIFHSLWGILSAGLVSVQVEPIPFPQFERSVAFSPVSVLCHSPPLTTRMSIHLRARLIVTEKLGPGIVSSNSSLNGPCITSFSLSLLSDSTPVAVLHYVFSRNLEVPLLLVVPPPDPACQVPLFLSVSLCLISLSLFRPAFSSSSQRLNQGSNLDVGCCLPLRAFAFPG